MKRRFLLLFSAGIISLFFFANFVLAAHYVVGYAEDAKDGTSVNGRTAVIWKTSVGIQDNATDIIGISGDSGTDNYYLIDCEMLSSSCNVGDNISVGVINDGTDYVGRNNITLIVTGSGFDYATSNLTINSPPSVTASFPSLNQKINNGTINFLCDSHDLDSDLQTINLYGNWSGVWQEEATRSVSGINNQNYFQENIPDGYYEYGCEIIDSSQIIKYSSNVNFSVDSAAPIITAIMVNSTSSCGTQKVVRVGCNVSDSMSSFNVYIVANNSAGQINYSAALLSGNFYYRDIAVNRTGEWNFGCYAIDSYNNSNTLNYSTPYEVYSSSYVDLYLNLSEISLNVSNPIEGQQNYIQTKVYSIGCADVENLKIGFYTGNPNYGGLNIWNDSIYVQNNSFNSSRAPWITQIGTNNLFVMIDPDNSLSELNRTNNQANKTFYVNAWQKFYGNLSVSLLLGESKDVNMSAWYDAKNITGNIFIADKESQINWATLAAVGQTQTGTVSSTDFQEIDSALGMSDFNDSVYNIFTNSGTIKQTENFTLHGNNITNVPVINSSYSNNFHTGILWDYSNSSSGKYNSNNKDSILFVSKVETATIGQYGTYDYELSIPAKLRDYKGPDFKEVYLYYEID